MVWIDLKLGLLGQTSPRLIQNFQWLLKVEIFSLAGEAQITHVPNGVDRSKIGTAGSDLLPQIQYFQ